MKKIFLLICLPVIITGAVFAQDIIYNIGSQGPAGGLVFYDKGIVSEGWRYLEAAPAGADYYAQWSVSGKNIPGTKTTTGSGRANTEIIANRLNELGENNMAAQICAGLNINGFTDWFLPSKDELELMYKNLKQIGLGGFSNNVYWSSSQGIFSYAWYQRFIDGYQKSDSKSGGYLVRAVRAF